MSPLPSSCSAPCSPMIVRLSILRGDVEGDPRRQVRLDHAGDDIDRRPLRRHDQVDARRARLLREPLDQEFDFLASGHHQVGKFVDDHHDLRHGFVGEALFLILRLAGHRVVTDLHLAAQRRALGLCRADFLVEIGEIAYTDNDDIIR